MKAIRFVLTLAATTAVFAALAVSAGAMEYTFEGVPETEYYPSTNYEDAYGSRYNYGGSNAVDYVRPELPYGHPSNTSIGAMEKVKLPGIVFNSGSATATNPVVPGSPSYSNPPPLPQNKFTSTNDVLRSDGSIGTLKISSLGINVKVYDGETLSSMRKGVGHFSSTSAWDGNIGVCGHNRGANYVIGNIKDLAAGDRIQYTTSLGTRTYSVATVTKISSSDWSYLNATSDNRITLITCAANEPTLRWCVQAVEVK